MTVYGNGMLVHRVLLLALSLICWMGLRLSGRQWSWEIILCYHAVCDSQRVRFARQIGALLGRSYEAGSISSTHASSRAGKVGLTFDDAFACLLRNALPLAAEHGIPTTIFVVAGNMGALPQWRMRHGHPEALEPVMTAAEIMAAEREYGCRIGSHTLSHRALATLSPDEAFAELADSKRQLECILGHPVEDLAAPYGSYDHAAVSLAMEAGYKRFFTLDRTSRRSGPDGMVIGRYLMSPDAWWLEFWLTINGGYSWIFPLQRLLSRIRGGGAKRRSTQFGPSIA